MSTMTSTTAPAPLGGFSPTFIGLELRRVLRNKRSLIFTFLMPTVFFLLFGTSSSYKTASAGNGNVTAWIMVSMALYGAMLATTSGGAAVATERALGWSRQLRMTPLQPLAYVAVKTVVALMLGALSIVPVFVVGNFMGAKLPWADQLACAALIWVCAAVFAGLGLAMGYLLPSENVMQLLGPALAILAFAGGLFVPLNTLGSTFETIAKFTPAYGAGQIARLPFGSIDSLATAIANLVIWGAVFIGIAAWRMTKDTSRV